MAWDVSADVVDFEEAIAWFREKLPPRHEFDWDALEEKARGKAFTVAGVAQLDIAADVYDAIDEALTTGISLEDFKAIVSDELEQAWGGSVADPGWRIETIFRTNVQSAYAAGRYAQMTDPTVLEDRPYWVFEVIEDGRECDICEPCDDTVLEASDPWWRSHQVPLHPNCRCETHSLSAEDAQKRGVDPVGPNVEAADGFGTPPELGAWAPRAAEYPPDLWNVFQEKARATGTEGP